MMIFHVNSRCCLIHYSLYIYILFSMGQHIVSSGKKWRKVTFLICVQFVRFSFEMYLSIDFSTNNIISFDFIERSIWFLLRDCLFSLSLVSVLRAIDPFFLFSFFLLHAFIMFFFCVFIWFFRVGSQILVRSISICVHINVFLCCFFFSELFLYSCICVWLTIVSIICIYIVFNYFEALLVENTK